jgi:hypothetical protein
MFCSCDRKREDRGDLGQGVCNSQDITQGQLELAFRFGETFSLVIRFTSYEPVGSVRSVTWSHVTRLTLSNVAFKSIQRCGLSCCRATDNKSALNYELNRSQPNLTPGLKSTRCGCLGNRDATTARIPPVKLKNCCAKPAES